MGSSVSRFSVVLGAVALAAVCSGQVGPSRQAPNSTPATASQAATLSSLLPQTAQNINVDVSELRIDKWKNEGGSRQQAEQNAASISRNVRAALPGMIGQVQTNPQSLGAAVKLYRNVNALYDVFSNLAESAGAFGSRQDYQRLAADAANLDNIRRAMGDQLEAMAASTDTEVARLRTQVARAATPATPPKKIIVDDEKPASTKKKTTQKKPATATPTATKSQSPNPQ